MEVAVLVEELTRPLARRAVVRQRQQRGAEPLRSHEVMPPVAVVYVALAISILVQYRFSCAARRHRVTRQNIGTGPNPATGVHLPQY